MKHAVTGILILVVFMLVGCVSRETYETAQQDLLTAEEAISDQQAQIVKVSNELNRANEALETEQGRSAELASGLEQAGAELEETQTTLASTQVTLADTQGVIEDTRTQLADAQEQLRAISETPFGIYNVIDTLAGEQLWSAADSEEVLINGYAIIKSDEDIKFRRGVRDIALGEWQVMAVSAPGVEVNREVLSGLIVGSGVSRRHIAIGYEEVLEHFSSYSADHYGSELYTYIPCHFEPDLGWVNDYPIRILNHPLIEFLVNDVYGHAEPLRFEAMKTKQAVALALDPELIVQARESAAEAGVDFEEWLAEAILTKIR